MSNNIVTNKTAIHTPLSLYVYVSNHILVMFLYTLACVINNNRFNWQTRIKHLPQIYYFSLLLLWVFLFIIVCFPFKIFRFLCLLESSLSQPPVLIFMKKIWMNATPGQDKLADIKFHFPQVLLWHLLVLCSVFSSDVN